MKVAYLIVAHNTPKHLQRLISALSSSSSTFFIHLDKKSRAEEYSGIATQNVHIISERIPVYWGDYSLVEAILILLRAALSDRGGFDRAVLLSGADYPLRSASYIERFFANNVNCEFMDLLAMPCEAMGKPISRLTTYKVRPGGLPIVTLARKVLSRLGIPARTRNHRDHLRDLAPYAGSAWWALSRPACEIIFAFAKAETQVVEFFKNTHCPDESFFHTILANSELRPRILRSLTFADWSAGQASPANVTERHLAFFQSTSSFAENNLLGTGEMLFARKFPDDSEKLVTKLASQIRENEDSNPTTRHTSPY